MLDKCYQQSDDKALALFLKASYFFEHADDDDAAIPVLKKLVSEYPGQQPEALPHLVALLQKTGRIDEAMEALKAQGAVLKPGDPIPEPALWFHDIFRIDGTPFDKEEIDFIRGITGGSRNNRVRSTA